MGEIISQRKKKKVSFPLLLYFYSLYKHLSHTLNPQTCYLWAGTVDQTDKNASRLLRVHTQRKEVSIHGYYSRSAAAFLQTLDSASLACHWGGHFPIKAHEISPPVPCRNQLPRFDERARLLFQSNARSREDFSFKLFWFCNFFYSFLHLIEDLEWNCEHCDSPTRQYF